MRNIDELLELDRSRIAEQTENAHPERLALARWQERRARRWWLAMGLAGAVAAGSCVMLVLPHGTKENPQQVQLPTTASVVRPRVANAAPSPPPRVVTLRKRMRKTEPFRVPAASVEEEAMLRRLAQASPQMRGTVFEQQQVMAQQYQQRLEEFDKWVAEGERNDR